MARLCAAPLPICSQACSLPTLRAVPTPLRLTMLTATPLEGQITPEASAALLPPEYSPVAVNACVPRSPS